MSLLESFEFKCECILANNQINHKVFSICFFLTSVMHVFSAADFPLFRSKMPYYAGRMLASKIDYYARNSAGRIYPSLSLEQALPTEHGLNGTRIVFPAKKKKKHSALT